ncbi:MAG TPA: O-methyltransferase [Limnochordia bacterium]
MDLLHPKVGGYLDELARHDDPVLAKMEARARSSGFPIVGPVAGRFCYQIARLLGARRVFELGSGYGYSTLWFAKAVAENGGGEVFHNVWDEGLSRDAQAYLREAGLAHLVRFRVSEAVEALRQTPGPFDIIFNDIDKEGYPASLAVIKEKLRPGGVLIIDNVLWQGRLFDADDTSPSTAGVREVTRMVYADPDFFTSLLPLRDGLLVALKRD